MVAAEIPTFLETTEVSLKITISQILTTSQAPCCQTSARESLQRNDLLFIPSQSTTAKMEVAVTHTLCKKQSLLIIYRVGNGGYCNPGKIQEFRVAFKNSLR